MPGRRTDHSQACYLPVGDKALNTLIPPQLALRLSIEDRRRIAARH